MTFGSKFWAWDLPILVRWSPESFQKIWGGQLLYSSPSGTVHLVYATEKRRCSDNKIKTFLAFFKDWIEMSQKAFFLQQNPFQPKNLKI